MTTVLAIDPSLRGTGYAVLCGDVAGKIRALGYGVIKNLAKASHEACLLAIYEGLRKQIVEFAPSQVAIESTIYVQSYETAIILGTARGVALLAAAQAGLPVFQYAPRRVKQAVVGRGGAQKHQVAFMIRALLGLTETPPPDAADALAVGMAHLQKTKF